MPTKPHTREFSTPEDLRDRTFLDALDDAFTPLEDLVLHKPDYGYLARIRDGHRIREDFRKAFSQVKQEHDRRASSDD